MKRIKSLFSSMRSVKTESVSDMIAANAYTNELRSELVDSFRV